MPPKDLNTVFQCNNFAVFGIYNDKDNITCGKLLSTLIDQIPGRFDAGNKVTPVPFRKNDKIVYYCTVTAGAIKRIYGIHIYVV